MINEFVLANAAYFVLFLFAAIVFLLGVVVKGYVLKKFNEPKRGTVAGCPDCIAMTTVVSKIPIIEEKQEILRRIDLPTLSTQIAKLQSSVDTLERSVEKLFHLLEQDWLQKIDRLEGAFLKSVQAAKPTKSRDNRGTRAKS